MQIIFNGKPYNSLEEMPANERQAYEHLQQIFVDANGNGIPDFMEGDMARNVMTAFTTRVVSEDGKIFNGLDDLPPEKREKVEKAFAKLTQMGILTGGLPTSTASQPAPFEPAFQPSKPIVTQEPTFQESDRNRWILIVGFLAAALVCAVAIAVFAFLR
jgi:hypothetical protein